MAEREIPKVGGEPSDERRTLVLAFIALILGLQLLIPLRYYLGDDPYDERFSWRMFSAVRVHRCQLQPTETETDGNARIIDINREVHRAWVSTLQRNRKSVSEKFLASRCADVGIASARLENQCVTPNGTRLDPIIWEMSCASGEITEPDIRLERDDL
ncbi:MAG: hypothetical protein JRH11_25580 [Deltaproteobacteria bacterium]|nr:hypothetical protein [Deltaproteobacteria bacterium]